jgi:hypothetical protein
MACITPFSVKNKISGETIPVPCGKCPNCKKRRISGWSFRLMQEYKVSNSAHFITLTYDTKNAPITKKGYMNLNKRDLQLFFKRLRKRHEKGTKIKYYACGEYGGKTYRPHYHIILFGADINFISQAWDLGHVHYGTVNEASVGYTLKYISKNNKIPLHQNDDRQKEFSLMSKGLGKNYMSKAMIKWHKNDLDNRFYVNLTDGKKIAMPRYYKDKIYTDDERKRVAFFTRLRMIQQIKKELQLNENYFHEQALNHEYIFTKHNFRVNIKIEKL